MNKLMFKWNGLRWMTRGFCFFKRKAKSFKTVGAFGNQEWNKSIPEGYDFTFKKEKKDGFN